MELALLELPQTEEKNGHPWVFMKSAEQVVSPHW